MKNVVVRSLSGVIYIAIIVAAVVYGGEWLRWLCILLFAMGVTEYTRMCCGERLPRIALMLDLLAGGSFIYGMFSGAMADGVSANIAFSLFLIFLVLRLISQLYSTTDNAIAALGRSLTGLLYIALPLGLMSLLYNEVGAHVVLAMFIFIWMNDTGAFCTGVLIGRHKLFERISPKKTWEGFFGGVAFTIASAFVMCCCFGSYFKAPASLFFTIAVLTPLAATYGDLIESQLKRTAGVKDSGHIIPGHGGILDRIDSLLLVIPVIFSFVILYNL